MGVFKKKPEPKPEVVVTKTIVTLEGGSTEEFIARRKDRAAPFRLSEQGYPWVIVKHTKGTTVFPMMSVKKIKTSEIKEE